MPNRSPADEGQTLVSIVVPVFNEQDNVDPLLAELQAALNSTEYDWEILLVDDGSNDATWERISNATSRQDAVKGLRFSRNFGHQAALLAGMTFATGDVIITMDGDLQHPPDQIPRLLSEWSNGFRVVHTRRVDGDKTSAFKSGTSKYFYRAFTALSDIELPEGSSDFRLYDRDVVDVLLASRGASLFLRGMVHWAGYPSTTVDYELRDRHSGTTKFSLRKMLRFAQNGIIAFSVKPLRLGVWIGLLTAVLAFLELAYVLLQYLLGNTVTGWASTLGLLAFLFGILFIVIGILGTYVAQIHEVLQGKPDFVLSDSSNFDPSAAAPRRENRPRRERHARR